MLIGLAITEEQVRQNSDDRHSEVTPAMLSKYTLNHKNKYDLDAAKKVNAMSQEYGGSRDAVLIRIYNASGGILSYMNEKSWHGRVWKYPYDQTIQNGQWSVVLNVEPRCMGAVVYRGLVVPEDLFFGWSHTAGSWVARSADKTYVENRPIDQWPDLGSWTYMENLIERSSANSNDIWSFKVSASIGTGTAVPMLDIEVSHP